MRSMRPNLSNLDEQTVRSFVQMAGDEGLLSGRVLDYGCGRQPYRKLVKSFGGEYTGYDRLDFPGNVSGEDIGTDDLWYLGEDYDTVLMTQVVQYIPVYPYYDGLEAVLGNIYTALDFGGHLVMTYPTNWPEVEAGDLHRFTKTGMEWLLARSGFTISLHLPRHHTTTMDGRQLVHGYGLVAHT